MLANRGYDVWLGNKHSRRHSKYDPNKGNEFWEFTFQHMADFDLPAIFSYVNALTHQKIHYIGRSQGTTQSPLPSARTTPSSRISLTSSLLSGQWHSSTMLLPTSLPSSISLPSSSGSI